MASPHTANEGWAWWRRALAGGNPPSLVLGVPEQGYFLLRERHTTRVPEGQRKVGGSRHTVETFHYPVAIWQDESGWHCVTYRPGSVSYLTDPAEIDERVFARCSRSPITYENYAALRIELEPEK